MAPVFDPAHGLMAGMSNMGAVVVYAGLASGTAYVFLLDYNYT
jgi:hypothetical protein